MVVLKKKSDELFKKIEYEETINEKIETLMESQKFEVINIADSVMKSNIIILIIITNENLYNFFLFYSK